MIDRTKTIGFCLLYFISDTAATYGTCMAVGNPRELFFLSALCDDSKCVLSDRYLHGD